MKNISMSLDTFKPQVTGRTTEQPALRNWFAPTDSCHIRTFAGSLTAVSR